MIPLDISHLAFKPPRNLCSRSTVFCRAIAVAVEFENWKHEEKRLHGFCLEAELS